MCEPNADSDNSDNINFFIKHFLLEIIPNNKSKSLTAYFDIKIILTYILDFFQWL